MNDCTIPKNQKQSIPVTGEPERLPLCEICGNPHPKTVTILDRGAMQVCDDCRRLFGFGGEDDKQ